MGALIPLILSSINSYQKRQEEANKVPREKFIDQLEKSAAFGETAVFNDPKTYKAAEKYKVAEVFDILNHITRSDMTAEERAAKVAGLRGNKASGEATQAAGESETQRQRTVVQPAIKGGAQGMNQRRQEAPGSTGFNYDNPAETEFLTTPAQRPSGAGTTAATTRGQDVSSSVARRGQDFDREASKDRTSLGYYDTNAKLHMATQDIEQRGKELEEKKRTTVSAADKLKLDKEGQGIDRERIAVARQAVQNDERRTGLVEREQSTKFVETLLEGSDLKLGAAARASRELRNFFDGKTDTISKEVEDATGFSTKKLTAVKGIVEESRKLENDASKMMDDVISAKKGPKKGQTALSDQEIDSRLAEANAKLYKAVAYKVANRLIENSEAVEELMTGMRVYAGGDVLSPKMAMGLGRKFTTALPPQVQQMMGGDKQQLAPEEQAVMDRWLGGKGTPKAK